MALTPFDVIKRQATIAKAKESAVRKEPEPTPTKKVVKTTTKQSTAPTSKKEQVLAELASKTTQVDTSKLKDVRKKLPEDQPTVPVGAAFEKVEAPPVAPPTATDRVGMTATPQELRYTTEAAVKEAQRTGESLQQIQQRERKKVFGRYEPVEPKKPGEKISLQEYQEELYEQEQQLQEQAQRSYSEAQRLRRIPFTADVFANIQRMGDIAVFEKQSKELQDIKSSVQQQRQATYDWYPKTKVRKIKQDEGYMYEVDFPFSGADIYHSTTKKIRERDFTGLLATAFTPSDPLGLKSAYYQAVGKPEEAWKTKVAAVADVRRPFHEFYLASPMGVIGTTAVVSTGVGAGVGALSAVSPIAGKAVTIGMGAYFTTKATGDFKPIVEKAIKTGDYGQIIGAGTSVGLAIGAGYAGYKAGYTAGYGRVEQALYLRGTYKPGTSEYIQARASLKVARKLRYVKSKDIEPLDFAKDIMRLDPKTASKVISYLEQHPRTVVGGSASQYAQVSKKLWYKHRDIKPRDVDLLTQPIKKDYLLALKYKMKDIGVGRYKGIKVRELADIYSEFRAKHFFGQDVRTPAGTHKLDIHSSTFGGKPGQYIRFGFETQKPIKIGNRLMRLGEQITRKAVSSVTKETQYRWYKDIPDFKMISEQLISSAKRGHSPVDWMRAISAEKALGYVTQPETYPGFGKTPGIVSKLATGFAEKVYTPSPVPPAGAYPYTYYPTTGFITVPYAVTYKPTTQSPYTPSYKPPTAPPYPTITKIPSPPPYKPTTTPPYTPTTPPQSQPPYKPVKTPPYKPVKRPYMPEEQIKYDEKREKKRKTPIPIDFYGKKYRFKAVKIESPFKKLFKGGI